MITISLCMIVRDEEKTIARCLDSVKHIVDEINIVDTGSVDRTKEIVSEYTDRIYDFTWIDDFAAARNHSFSKATKEYIFWLDADDFLLEEDQKKLLALKETLDTTHNSVSMFYHLSYDLEGNPTATIRRNRLLKRTRGFKWCDPIHEHIPVFDDEIFYSDIAIRHKREHQNATRNMDIYEKRLARAETFSTRDLMFYAGELMENHYYEKAIGWFEKFFDQEIENFEDNVASCGKVAHCYHKLGDRKKELQYLLKSFEFAPPNPEYCCRIGFYFFEQNIMDRAIFWYNLALQIEKPVKSWGIVHLAASSWLPHLQLAICYGRVGNVEKAYYHNEIALTYLPNDADLNHNKEVLEDILFGKG